MAYSTEISLKLQAQKLKTGIFLLSIEMVFGFGKRSGFFFCKCMTHKTGTGFDTLNPLIKPSPFSSTIPSSISLDLQNNLLFFMNNSTTSSPIKTAPFSIKERARVVFPIPAFPWIKMARFL